MYCTLKYADVHKYGVLSRKFPSTTLEIKKRKFGKICSNIRTWKSMEIIKCTWICIEILLLYVDVHGNSGVHGFPCKAMYFNLHPHTHQNFRVHTLHCKISAYINVH